MGRLLAPVLLLCGAAGARAQGRPPEHRGNSGRGHHPAEGRACDAANTEDAATLAACPDCPNAENIAAGGCVPAWCVEGKEPAEGVCPNATAPGMAAFSMGKPVGELGCEAARQMATSRATCCPAPSEEEGACGGYPTAVCFNDPARSALDQLTGLPSCTPLWCDGSAGDVRPVQCDDAAGDDDGPPGWWLLLILWFTCLGMFTCASKVRQKLASLFAALRRRCGLEESSGNKTLLDTQPPWDSEALGGEGLEMEQMEAISPREEAPATKSIPVTFTDQKPIGITLSTAEATSTADGQKPAVQISTVAPGSQAAACGLCEGMVLLTVDEQEVRMSCSGASCCVTYDDAVQSLERRPVKLVFATAVLEDVESGARSLPQHSQHEPEPEPEPEPGPGPGGETVESPRSPRLPGQLRHWESADQEKEYEAAFAGFRSASEICNVEEIEVERYLSKGTSGTVSQARWQGMAVAVKKYYFVDDGSANSAAMLASFKNEVFLMRQLQHVNLVRFFGASDTAPNLCIVMELMRGSLADLFYGKLSKGVEKMLTPQRQLSVLRGVTSGMLFLHAHSVIHRDLKSANVLFDKQLRIKLCDFAFSKFKLAAAAQTTAAFESSVGTPAWMAPEVLRGDEYTLRADVYSL